MISDGEFSGVEMSEKTSDIFNGKDLSSYYRCLSGGFKLVQATRMTRTYWYQAIKVEKIESTDMGYKNDIFFTPPFDEIYRAAYDYLTTEHPERGFTPGKYGEILRLDGIYNEYFEVRTIDGDDKQSVKYYSEMPHVYNDFWKVFYKTTDIIYYSIVKKTAKTRKDFWTYFGISSITIVLLAFVFLYKPGNSH